MNHQQLYKIGITLSVLLLAFVPSNAQSTKKMMKAGKDSLEKKRYEGAIQLFSNAIAIDQSLLNAYILRAEAYEKTNQIKAAANDYSKASSLKPKDEKLSYEAGRLLYDLGKPLEAIRILNHSIENNKKFLPSYLVKINCLITLKNYEEALTVCNKALDIKKTAQNYYNHGRVAENLNQDKVAEEDYRNAIKTDKTFKESFVGMANVLARQFKTEEALKYCNEVISTHPDYWEAYFTRSNIYYKKSDVLNAISDLSKTIGLIPQNDTLYIIRAGYYHEIKQTEKAVSDYSKAISWKNDNPLAYYKRAILLEQLNKNAEATSDFEVFLKLAESNQEMKDMVKLAKQKVYDLNAEEIAPDITLNSPIQTKNGAIEIALNVKSIKISGIIKDQSQLEYLRINEVDINYDNALKTFSFDEEIRITDLDKITISASDIYHNKKRMVYPIIRTEIDPPLIHVMIPYTSEYDEIFLDFEAPMLFVEGKLIDESFIKSVIVDGVEAKFFTDKKNPHFSANVNISEKTHINIKAVDYYGNTTEKTFKLNRETARILAVNPMGKTWVVFIDNSNYESFTSLDGPAKDISLMKSAFSKYDIHNTIEKKNLTKMEMEKFFAIELRDLVKNQKVNSLLVWYAGHGKFINETGYWIPIDAKRDEEFTYFNVNNLKGYMQSYTKFVNHVLVVTDACESGPSFYAAMRGTKNRICSDVAPTKFKSSQVFSSAGNELASDNSIFTKTFAKSLDYNNNDCIAIDNIVITITESFKQGSKQSPKFGKIQGLEDEDGTFFFIKKTQ